LKILANTTKWLFILTLPALIITATIRIEFSSLWLYQNGFEKYNVSQTTGLSETELEKAASGIINYYFHSDEEYINVIVLKDGKPFELFNEREVAHLKDVKELVQLNSRLLMGTAIYIGIYAGMCLFWRRKKYRRNLARATVIGSSITLGMIVALGVGAMVGSFDRLFLQLHFLTFTNELWMLDPTKDYLIMLFPEGFWFDVAMLFGQITTGVAGTLLAVALIYLRSRRKQAKAQENCLPSHITNQK
jgi:integral membrane protein (TIGR01906 family)